MSELPTGWAAVNLGELADFEMGQAPPGATCNTNGVGTVFVKAGEFGREYPIVREWTTQPLKFARTGDVLICVVGATSGKLNLGVDCAIGRSVAAIRPNGAIQQKTLYRELLLQVEQLRADSTGTAQGVLSKQMLADINLVLPPLREQTRITDQLDKLLARIQSCNDRLDAIPALLKRFRQAVLDAATLGELTLEWREANGLPFEWKKLHLQDIADVKGGVTKDSKKQSASDEEVPYLRVANVQRGYIDLREIKTIRVPHGKLEELLLESGDVLFNEGGDLDKLGRGWVWEGQISRCTFQNHVFRARLYDPLNQPKFVSWWGNSRGLEYFLRAGKQTTNLASINKTMLAALPISLPSVEEQAEIVRRVEALFKLADRIEARYTAASAQAQRLTPLLLAKAFRGELVQQDPQDEPASVLLERLAATSPAKVRTSRGRQRIKPERLLPLPEPKPADWTSFPDGAWVAPADPEGLATMVCVTAVLRAWGKPVPEREARLAALFCLQPRLFTAVLPFAEAKQWSRLVGDEARPLPAQVLSFQPAINNHWGRAIKGMSARGDLVEAGTGSDTTWALGASTGSIETAGWPDGRAGFVVAYLRANGTDSVLPLLETSAQEFANARAA